MLFDNSQVLANLGTLLTYFFPFWAVVVAAGLTWRKRALNGMIFFWLLMAGIWALTLFRTTTLPSFLLPEPWNTLLFFVSGVVLFLLLVSRTARHQLKT